MLPIRPENLLARGHCTKPGCACTAFDPLPWLNEKLQNPEFRKGFEEELAKQRAEDDVVVTEVWRPRANYTIPPLAPANCPLRHDDPLPESQCDLELCSDCEASPNLCPIPPTKPPRHCSLHTYFHPDCGGCKTAALKDVNAGLAEAEALLADADDLIAASEGRYVEVHDGPLKLRPRPGKAEAHSVAAGIAEQEERRKAIDHLSPHRRRTK
jgi:hypothetical protein